MERFDADKALKELKDRVDGLRATRNQILQDQRTNAKRDEKTLKAERAWYKKNRPNEPYPWDGE